MTEFVWFFGASGAGKETLIKKVARGEFHLPGFEGQLIICHESLDWKREKRVAELERQLGRYAVLDAITLIKGQSIDISTLRLPTNIHNEYPALKQSIVFVFTDPIELPNRTGERKDNYWPKPKHDYASETQSQIVWLESLSEDLNINPIIIDNSGPDPQIMEGMKLTGLK